MDKLLKVSLAAYILSLFVFNNIQTDVNYISLILFMVCSILTLIKCVKEKKISFNKYFLFYCTFIILGIISYFYAIYAPNVISKTVQLIINAVIIVIYTNYINTEEKLDYLLKVFVTSGILISALLIITSDYANATRYNRLGAQLGNVNLIATQISYALSALLIIKNKTKNKYYILAEILMIVAIVFTGSRKGIIMALMLLILSAFFKNINNASKTIKNIAVSILIAGIVIIVIMNNSYLYNMVGVRFETFFAFLRGEKVTEVSVLSRNNMIEAGLDWFTEKPILGYGLDNYRYLYFNQYGYDYYAHNNYVEILVDLGIVGLIVYSLIYIYPLKKLLKMKLYKDYKACIFFTILFIQIFMDFAMVSYLDRVLLIYISIIFSYINLYDKERNNKKVSVIMSTFNTPEQYLRKSIESILSQTHKNIEFIIVNDGSKIDMDIINEYDDCRIKIINHEQNKGLPYSLNEAIAIATGEYIARMDSDDIAKRNRIELQVDYMERNKDIGICGMFAKNIGSARGFSLTPFYSAEEVKSLLLFKCALIHPTVMFRSSFIKENNIEYNTNFKYAQDFELWSRCSLLTNISIIPRVGLYLRIHKNQISTSKKEEQYEYYYTTLNNNVKLIDSNENKVEILNTLLIVNEKKEFELYDIEKIYNNVEFIIDNNSIYSRKKLKAVINNVIFNIVLTKLKSIKSFIDLIKNKKSRKMLINFRNIFLSIKRIYLIIKCLIFEIIGGINIENKKNF